MKTEPRFIIEIEKDNFKLDITSLLSKEDCEGYLKADKKHTETTRNFFDMLVITNLTADCKLNINEFGKESTITGKVKDLFLLLFMLNVRFKNTGFETDSYKFNLIMEEK
jgi:hypothetical protein